MSLAQVRTIPSETARLCSPSRGSHFRCGSPRPWPVPSWPRSAPRVGPPALSFYDSTRRVMAALPVLAGISIQLGPTTRSARSWIEGSDLRYPRGPLGPEGPSGAGTTSMASTASARTGTTARVASRARRRPRPRRTRRPSRIRNDGLGIQEALSSKLTYRDPNVESAHSPRASPDRIAAVCPWRTRVVPRSARGRSQVH